MSCVRGSGEVVSRRELQAGSPLRVEDLALNGRDLIAFGLKPGPRFGVILGDLMDRVLEDPSVNTPNRLKELVRSAGYLSEDVK